MFPLITHIFGIYEANAFKIANDFSLLICRAAIKTIGTTDATMLAHAHQDGSGKTTMQDAFARVTTRSAALCIPLLGIVGVMIVKNYPASHTSFSLFALMTTGYLLETILAPCERLLEIKKRYLAIILSYLPCLAITLCMLFGTVASIGLLSTIALVQLVRLVTALLLAGILAYTDHIYLPFMESLRITMITLLSLLTIALLT